jgi:hypothetical protein
MNKIEKYLTIAFAIVGGVAGPWGAYTAHDASKFKQPFDEHDEIAKSYTAQIFSAERRADTKEVTRIRLLYEVYEERWRAVRQIAQIVAPIENLDPVQLSAQQSEGLKILLARVSADPSHPTLPAKTLGAAYLAIKDFDNAAAQFNVATSKTNDSKILALKAAAFSGLAFRTTNPSMKLMYETTAVESYVAAQKVTPKSLGLTAFAVANPNLKAVLDNKGIEIMDR